jgi:hypothetical protein
VGALEICLWAHLYLLVLFSESAAIVKRALTYVLEVRIPDVTYHTFFLFHCFLNFKLSRTESERNYVKLNNVLIIEINAFGK